MRVVSITGASGFIGRHLLTALENRADLQLRVLVHRNKKPFGAPLGNRVLIEGDVTRAETLEGFLEPGATVVNLAYPSTLSASEKLLAATSLVEAATRAGIKRLIHCSTAVVVGRAQTAVVDEGTVCEPKNEYEITKLTTEKILQEKSDGKFELTILRPTAVFGAGGRNLLKLATDVATGSRVSNYLKSCLYGYRKMNLVCVRNVVAALLFLIDTDKSLDREVFIISDDECAGNNYRDVERRLMQCFGMNDYVLKPIILPNFILSLLLRLTGRSNINPRRVYSSYKLSALGYRKAASFDAELTAFGNWYKNQFLVNR